jgi:hypothetical protein
MWLEDEELASAVERMRYSDGESLTFIKTVQLITGMSIDVKTSAYDVTKRKWRRPSVEIISKFAFRLLALSAVLEQSQFCLKFYGNAECEC